MKQRQNDLSFETERSESRTYSILDSMTDQISSNHDFYDAMRQVTQLNLNSWPKNVVEVLCELAPNGRALKSLEENDIHGMIARWTASKFHTAPIHKVILDIKMNCILKHVGLYVYNSNLNPNNPRAANDPYILIVTERKMCFVDLNRKITYHYVFYDGGIPHAQDGNL